MLVFAALAASALLAAVAFGVAGRKAAFNYNAEESYTKGMNIAQVIDDVSDDLTLWQIYEYILYPSGSLNTQYFIADADGNIVIPDKSYQGLDDKGLSAAEFVNSNINNEEVWDGNIAFLNSGFEEQSMIIKIPFTNENAEYYVIQHTVINENSDLINNYVNIILLSTLAAALAMMIPTVIIVELVTEPLQEVNRTAKEYGRGNLLIRRYSRRMVP